MGAGDSPSMRIVGFIKTSLLDWDGKVTSVVFTSGCNFRCPFCQNVDVVEGHLDEVEMDRIDEYVNENSDFLDGVVITGGEPTLHRDLHELIKHFKDMGVMVKLDSNGTNPDMLDDLIGANLIDFVAMDVKAPLDERYSTLCGTEAPLEDLKRSIDIIMSSGIDYEFRTTVVPVLHKEGDIEEIAECISGARKYALQQFVPSKTLDPSMQNLDPFPAATLHRMAERAKRHVRRVVLRGDV